MVRQKADETSAKRALTAKGRSKRQKLKIKKGDKVKVIAGKDISKEGEVEKVLRQKDRVVVAGVNLLKKHVRKRGEKEPGGIVTVTAPIHISNVMLVCPRCNKPTRVSYKIKKSGRRVRICHRCQEEID